MLNKLLRLPEKIPKDKLLHCLIGSVAASLLLSIGLVYWAVLSAVIVLAWGIEVYQLYTKSGHYDNYDALAVVVGGLIVIVPYWRLL